MRCIAAFIAMTTFSSAGLSAELYYCRAYNGGKFWANTHCRERNSLVERIMTVRQGMPFDQQVELGRQQLNGRNTSPGVTRSVTIVQQHQASPTTSCDALDARVKHYDAMARQPQSGQMQDWISAERKKARDQQFRMRC